MPKAPRSNSVVSSLLITLAAGIFMSSMIWTVCTDSNLSAVLWPPDIHSFVVNALGGMTRATFNGPLQTELSWLAVALRVFSGLLLFSAISSLGKWWSTRDLKHKAGETTVAGGWIESLRAISSPWLLSAVWMVAWFAASLSADTALPAFLATTAPLWLAVLLAGSITNFFSTISGLSHIRGAENPEKARWLEFCVVLLALFAWQGTSFWMNERLYAGLLVPHGDSAMYEEHLWNTWNGKGFRSYLDQGLFLGEHIQVIHLLLLPLHMAMPSYLMMEFVASFSLAICAWPIFSITFRHTRSSRAAMWLSLAWLAYFPMHYLDIAIDIKTLRPSCYGMPFLFWGIDFAERRRLWPASLCLLVALSTQEDFSLIVGSIGLVLFLIHWTDTNETETNEPARRRMLAWSGGVLIFSVVYLLLAVLVVIPAFRAGDAVHYSRYFGDLGRSPGELIATAIREPMRVIRVVASFRTLIYLAVLTVPVGLLAWRRPVFLLAGLPTFLMLSLIQLGNDSGVSGNTETQVVSELPPVPYHHFHAPLLPVIFWAAAAGLGSLRQGQIQRKQNKALQKPSEADRRSAVGGMSRIFSMGDGSSVAWAQFAFLCAVGSAVTGSMMPIGVNFWSQESAYGWRRLYVPGPRATEFPKVLAILPESSRVASTDYVHTRLTHFERSYDYSDYPRAVNNNKPGPPPDTDFIVIDTSHPYSRVRSLADVKELKEAPDDWEVLPDETGGLFIVLQRKQGVINENPAVEQQVN